MKIHYKSLIKATVAISSLCVASQAFAGEAAADEDTTVSANDIIVNARRIEERLQDVPISIVVVSQDQLNKANISSTDDLVRAVPGLNVESRYTSESNAFAIRGFSQALRTTASVGTFFAEVVAPRGGAGAFPGGDGAGPGSLFDLQNVQVLKGPQGTLFGRNTTGGDVLFTPTKPTDKFEGYLEGSYGNYNMFRIQGVVNVPLADWARLRLGVDKQTRNGYIHNVSGIGPKRFNDTNYTAYRGSLVLDLTPDLENYTIVSYLDSNHVGSGPQIYRANPFNRPFGVLAQPQIDRANATGDPYQIEQTLANPRSITRQFQVINTTKWDASDNLTIKNIMSYSSFRQILRQSVFGSNFPGGSYLAAIGVPLPLAAGIVSRASTAQAFNESGSYNNDQRSFTEELQLQGNAFDGKLVYQGGLYYEHSTPGGKDNPNESISVGAVCLVDPYQGLSTIRCLSGLGSSVNKSIYKIEYINMAAYAQATYAATDQLKLTAGIRLNYDRTNATSQSFRANFVGAPPLGAIIPIPLSQFVAPVIAAGAAGCQTTHAAFANCLVGKDMLNTSSTRPTWTFNAAYNPLEDAMLYATYSRGYRQGSAAPAAISVLNNNAYNPETVDNFELGGKTSFRGAVPGYFNLTGFYSKLRDAQLQIGAQCTLLVCPAGSTATSIFNAGRAHIYGVELDGSLKPADFFRVNFSGAYVKSRLDENTFDITPFTALFNNVLLETTLGGPLPRTPKYGANISATFTLPVPESVGEIEFSATYRYTSSTTYSASNTNTVAAAGIISKAQLTAAGCTAACIAQAAFVGATPVDKGSPIKQLDLNFDWRNVLGQPIDFSLFATNVTKQVTYNVIQPLIGSFGFDVRYLGQPRMFGARLRIRFGEGTSN